MESDAVSSADLSIQSIELIEQARSISGTLKRVMFESTNIQASVQYDDDAIFKSPVSKQSTGPPKMSETPSPYNLRNLSNLLPVDITPLNRKPAPTPQTVKRRRQVVDRNVTVTPLAAPAGRKLKTPIRGKSRKNIAFTSPDRQRTKSEEARGEEEFPERWLQDMASFRTAHEIDCASLVPSDRKVAGEEDGATLQQRHVVAEDHVCIHSYTVTPRFFTQPLNVDANGVSVCPVCGKGRAKPNSDSPGFVRVSVPESVLHKPYVMKARRRRSFDPSDSVALKDHCLVGAETVPHAREAPPAEVADLHSTAFGTRGGETLTLEQAETIARTHTQRQKIAKNQYRSRFYKKLANAVPIEKMV